MFGHNEGRITKELESLLVELNSIDREYDSIMSRIVDTGKFDDVAYVNVRRRLGSATAKIGLLIKISRSIHDLIEKRIEEGI